MKYWKKTKKETIQDSYTIYTNLYVEKNENIKVETKKKKKKNPIKTHIKNQTKPSV